MNILKIVKNHKKYRTWLKRVKGEEVVDFDRGLGFYINVDLVWQSLFFGLKGYDPIGRIEKFKMVDGRIAICTLLSYTTSCNPTDLIEHGYYQIQGYENDKLFKEMSFEEYLNCNVCCKLSNK